MVSRRLYISMDVPNGIDAALKEELTQFSLLIRNPETGQEMLIVGHRKFTRAELDMLEEIMPAHILSRYIGELG